MTTAQLEKSLLAYTRGLPKEAWREILEFVAFVRKKKGKEQSDNLTIELTELNKREDLLLEEEFKNYKDLYPRE